MFPFWQWLVVIVRRVVMPVSGAVSWTVLTDDLEPEPIELFLTCLAAVERSPNTQRAYATSLKLWYRVPGPWRGGVGGGSGR